MRNRQSLMRTFWWYAGEIGKENAYDVIEGLYGIRSLSRLSDDEIVNVIAEIQLKSGIDTTSKKKRAELKVTREKLEAQGYRVEISDAQLKKISVLFDRSGVTESHFQEIVAHCAADKFIGARHGGKVIGALLNLLDRKNKPVPGKSDGQPVRVELNRFYYNDFKIGHG